MSNLTTTQQHFKTVTSFEIFVSSQFQGDVNAICWHRELIGDYGEIVSAFQPTENITVIDEKQLVAMQLTEQGQLARSIILNDLQLLKNYGASPILNLIKCYERDDSTSFFPTDVYSFHADSSPINTDTFLCTYFGEPSEILPNEFAEKKVLVTEIRNELKMNFTGTEDEFENYLREHFFDLHYQAKPNANVISLGIGKLWRLAVDSPESKVQPCIHRAPIEKNGEYRLLLIC
ncbi:MAG: hypothetical protein RIQ33_53 [Bacteroidota bacterium]|jgi:hypothetical protein